MPWVWAAAGSPGAGTGGARPCNLKQHRARVAGRGRHDPRGTVVDPVEPARQIGAERGEIGLADDQGIGERHLSRRLGEAPDRVGAGRSVDDRDDSGQMQGMVERRVGAQRVKDRRRIGEAGGFDDQPAERADLPRSAPVEQAAQGTRQILAHGAAQAAARQFDNAAFDEIDQVMVDRDLADLVDDDGGVGERRRRQRAAQQGGLAAAEKTGQHRYRQGLGFGHRC